MSHEILDYNEEETTNIYYTKSVKKAKIAWILFGLFLLAVLLGSIFALVRIIAPSILVLIAYVISLLGFINGIQSFIKKENCGTNRVFVMIANFLIFGSITLLVFVNIFSMMMVMQS